MANTVGGVMAADRAPAGVNRAAITVCVILATLMQALDTTIANVALPYIQGSVSASQDEIAWVLTSYIVAAAIMTPPTGFLTNRFGLKRVFLVSVAGFTVASMLCGMAQSLVQIVLFRVLQGMFGAALVPLSQTVLLNINPKERARDPRWWPWGGRGNGRPGAWAGDWWLADRGLQLALCFLHQPADRCVRLHRDHRLSAGLRAKCRRQAGLVRLRYFKPRDRRHADPHSTAASAGRTGSAPARSSLKLSSPRRPSTCSSSILSPRTNPSCGHRCSETVTSPPGLLSSPSSASPTTPRWHCSRLIFRTS